MIFDICVGKFTLVLAEVCNLPRESAEKSMRSPFSLSFSFYTLSAERLSHAFCRPREIKTGNAQTCSRERNFPAKKKMISVCGEWVSATPWLGGMNKHTDQPATRDKSEMKKTHTMTTRMSAVCVWVSVWLLDLIVQKISRLIFSFFQTFLARSLLKKFSLLVFFGE